MPVIALKLNNIEGKRNKDAFKEVKINSTPKVTSVKEVDFPTLNKKVLSLGFEFVTKYDPELGQIRMDGDILFMSDKNAKVLKEWKAKKALPEEMNVEVLNYLFRACLIKISTIAEDLQLPPAVQLPRVRPKTDQTSYIG